MERAGRIPVEPTFAGHEFEQCRDDSLRSVYIAHPQIPHRQRLRVELGGLYQEPGRTFGVAAPNLEQRRRWFRLRFDPSLGREHCAEDCAGHLLC